MRKRISLSGFTSNRIGFGNTNRREKAFRQRQQSEGERFGLLSIEQVWSMTAKSTKFTCQHITLHLSVTTSCLLNWLHRRYSAIRASSVGYAARQTWLTSILSAILLYHWNEDKIDDWGSVLGHDDLSIIGRSATFCSAVDRRGRQNAEQNTCLPRIDESSCLDHFIWCFTQVNMFMQ